MSYPDTVIVILSHFDDVIRPLLESIETFNPSNFYFFGDVKGIIVVGDNHRRKYKGVDTIEVSDKFYFARNANIGIRACPGSDVFLINDDIRMIHPNCLSLIYGVAMDNPEVGILSPLISGGVGNPWQCYHKRLIWPKGEYLHIVGEGRTVCFPCVFLKRRMLDEIGLLDERILGYGGEDDEFCARARRAGWKCGILKSVVVQHGDGNPDIVSGIGSSWSVSYVRRALETGGLKTRVWRFPQIQMHTKF